MESITEPTTGKDILKCPSGCDFDEIEIGKEGQSFMAIMNAPYQYLRCGKCGFNDPEEKSHDMLYLNTKDSIDKWNREVNKQRNK